MIRLRQQGCTNNQTYRLVVIDKRAPRDGKYIEKLGWYNPFAGEEKNLFIQPERVEFWLGQGAQMSEKAKMLIKRFSPNVIVSWNEKKKQKKVRLKAKAKARKAK